MVNYTENKKYYVLFMSNKKGLAISSSRNVLEIFLFPLWWIFPRTCYKVVKSESLQKKVNKGKIMYPFILFGIGSLFAKIIGSIKLPSLYEISRIEALMVALMCYALSSLVLDYLFWMIQKKGVILELDYESEQKVKIKVELSIKNIITIFLIIVFQYFFLSLMASWLESPSIIDLINAIISGMIIQLLNMFVLSITYVSLDNSLYYPKQ